MKSTGNSKDWEDMEHMNFSYTAGKTRVENNLAISTKVEYTQNPWCSNFSPRYIYSLCSILNYIKIPGGLKKYKREFFQHKNFQCTGAETNDLKKQQLSSPTFNITLLRCIDKQKTLLFQTWWEHLRYRLTSLKSPVIRTNCKSVTKEAGVESFDRFW